MELFSTYFITKNRKVDIIFNEMIEDNVLHRDSGKLEGWAEK